jgi:hypothetical protein
VPPSTLPPQHVEIPVGDQTPPSTEVRGSPSPATRKPELVSVKPAKKPKRWQPLVSKTKVGSPSGLTAARRVSAWWPRGKVMNITFAVILVAVAAVVYKMMCQQSPPASQKSVTPDSLGVARKANADTTAKASAQKPKEQKPPVGTEQGSKSNVERKRMGEPVTLIRHSVPPVQLRKYSKQLTGDDVKKMLAERDFYDSDLNKGGKGITHQYEVIIRSGKELVLDHATGLTWQQSGSKRYMKYKETKTYIDSLNQENYGGYSNWHLPTLEEAMSLMEREIKIGFLYIAPEFDRTQRYIWTADRCSASAAWAVIFHSGICYDRDIGYYCYVRAVRSGQ